MIRTFCVMAALALPIVARAAPTDFSANPPAVPCSQCVLLLTVPASNGTTGGVAVQNQSGDTIQVVLDDGNGGTPTVLLLSGRGSDGGIFTGPIFRGRVRVYGRAGAQVAAYQN